jgi:hypothetical protein
MLTTSSLQGTNRQIVLQSLGNDLISQTSTVR